MDIHHIEICCNSLRSASNARAAGAKRIELCEDLPAGGTTAALETLKACVNDLHLDVFALIRPRSGDFCYSSCETETIMEDIRLRKKYGAAGIVVGFLQPDGMVDKELTAEAVQTAAPLPVTFHRAFDECRDWRQALEDIISCGCRRLLTSGCRPTAMEGIDNLREIVRHAGDNLHILAGSGINAQNVKTIVMRTGVHEVHGSCKQTLPNGDIETSEKSVKELISQCHEL